MKKIAITTMLFMAVLSSCVNEDFSDTGMCDETVTFNFHASDSFLWSTRAADIYSSDALQQIEQVQVYCFNTSDNGATWKFYKRINMDYEWIRGQNRLVHTIQRADMFPYGLYRFLAVGTDNLTDDYSISPMTVGMDFTEAYATLVGQKPQEIFSGYKDKEFNDSSENVDIFMTRRVAGVMLYVKNVPVSVTFNDIYGTPDPSTTLTVKYLRLAIQGSNTKVDITSSDDLTPEPTAATGAGYNIFDYDIASAQVDNNGDGYYDGAAKVGGVEKVANSTILGAYIVPVAFTTGATMLLSLVAPDGTTVIKQWTVINFGTRATYNIYSNYFYSIGKKLQAANTDNGSSGPNQDADDDDPIDLGKAQTITPMVGAGWKNSYLLSIEEVVSQPEP